MDIINTLWVEKYRPKKLEELVLPENYRIDFQTCIQKKEIGNLLFSGSPGSGKTALMRIICSQEGIIQNRDDNVLEINGSGKETRGISFVQDVIEPYLKIPPAGSDKYKVVCIDESDFLCLDGKTEIKIVKDDKIVKRKIEDLKDDIDIKVISVNLDTNNIEIDEAEYVDSGVAEMFEVELENGDIVICSENHPFFIIENGMLVEKKLKELEINSDIAILEENQESN